MAHLVEECCVEAMGERERSQTVFENSLVEHHVVLLPDSMGKVTYVVPAGHYSLKDIVLELELRGVKKQFTMLQHVRTPRPVASKLAADTLLLTGQGLNWVDLGITELELKDHLQPHLNLMAEKHL
uniref:V-type proton ATPase catalytic subunit A n=1 Tax=Tanacetum cinerariifolium TaxID=118510 RepID=A0A6L2J2L6_TANCI|nr:V-type proton ATPase catalytic subunit A [Tanacetum cinerariifolium]